MESVARFPAMIDGNKRTAWTLMDLMSWINGYRHDFTTDAAFDRVVGRRPVTFRWRTARGPLPRISSADSC